MQLIGFCGLAGHGKTTAAKHMELNYGFVRTAFAQPLKDMLKGLGCTDEELYGSLKGEPCALLDGVTPARAMQLLGTEWGRDLISANLWVNIWRKRTAAYTKVVVDDVRFPNEAEAVKEAGGVVVRIVRAGVLSNRPTDHASEQMAFTPDFSLDNSGTLEELRKMLDIMLVELHW